MLERRETAGRFKKKKKKEIISNKVCRVASRIRIFKGKSVMFCLKENLRKSFCSNVHQHRTV